VVTLLKSVEGIVEEANGKDGGEVFVKTGMLDQITLKRRCKVIVF